MITGTSISNSAGILLNDVDATRWTLAERKTFINEGRRAIAKIRPEIFGSGTEVTLTLGTGCSNVVSTNGAIRIVSLDSNVASGKAIRLCAKQHLDAFRSTWRADVGTDVQNWFPDETNPIGYWVSPAVPNGTVKAHVFFNPAELSSLDEEAIPNDTYEAALVNYVCFRALAKESEAGSTEKAAAFYQAFTSAFS